MPDVIEATGDAIGRYLDDLIDEFGDTRFGPLIEQQLEVIERDNDERLRNEVDPNGAPWAPLAQSTIDRKGFSSILVETGALGRSLLHRNDPNAIAVVVDEPGRGGFSRGTAVEYAGYHQTGTARMPARPAVGLEPEYVDELAREAADYLVETLKEQ